MPPPHASKKAASRTSIRAAPIYLKKGQADAHALGLRYFALGIPCPFLEDERCTIHPIRPLRCREYMVASPAEHCAHPETKEVIGVKPPVLLSRVLGKWNTSGDAHNSEFILLTMLDEWSASHPAGEDRATRTAPELLHEFLRTFASENTSEPTWIQIKADVILSRAERLREGWESKHHRVSS